MVRFFMSSLPQINFDSPTPSIPLEGLSPAKQEDFRKLFEKCRAIFNQIKSATQSGSLSPCQIIHLKRQLEFYKSNLQHLFDSVTSPVPATLSGSAAPKSRIEQLREKKEKLNAFYRALNSRETSTGILRELFNRIS